MPEKESPPPRDRRTLSFYIMESLIDLSYMNVHYIARPAIEDGSKLKIAAINPDFERSALLLFLMESAE